jgi:mycothiol synthase
MSKLMYDIRNYCPEDFDEFVHFLMEVRKAEPSLSPSIPWAIAEQLHRPHYNPTKDLFLATAGKKIIGYLDISRETNIKRIVLTGEIHPAKRRKGIATSLLNHALYYGSTIGIQQAHVNITEENQAATGLLNKLNFSPVRRYIELRLRLSDHHEPALSETNLHCRSLGYGEEQVLADLQNRVFYDTWGFNPNTKEDIIHCLKLLGCSPSDIILLLKGDSVIGYCWTVLQVHKGLAPDNKTSRIHMLGVAPEYRGQGTGKVLLSAGLRYLKERERASVVLTMDSENTTAHRLYLTAGFKIISTSLWYEKRLV